jgi:transcriptional regulator with XRE-family HTH domain
MKEELRKAVGQRMRKLRKTLGYTQEKMVSVFEIGRANYSRIEKGEVWPGVQILHILRTKFSVSLDWLVSNSGKMFARDRQDKSSEVKIDFGQYSEEIKELLNYLDKVPMVKHAILSYFLEYKVKNQNIIQHFLEEAEGSISQGQKAYENGSE